jgi:uncharacterized protein (TIGR01244 family)
MKTTGLFASIVLVAALMPALEAQQITKPTVAGVTNLSKLETTVACAGATGPEAMPDIKKMGFVSVINLRQASEPDTNIPAAEAAAKAVGLKYIHVPFNAAAPDPAVVDSFLAAIRQPGNEPAFIHCGSANRASAMWLIKRVQIDRWDVDKAVTEAKALGLTSAPLEKFALEYIQGHK